MISSIVDVPKKASEGDLFGINKYEKGLIEFIRNSDTPITIAIQGEWGSGKTSLMNSLQNSLCGDLNNIKGHDKDFYGIWVNTWQYSLMNSQEETLISIVSSISTQIMNIISTRHEGTGQKLASSVFNVFGKIAKTSAKIAADKVIEGGGDVVEALVNREKANQNIKNLRDDLQSAIAECLEKDKAVSKPKKGFLFFIDDLDRIDPPAAVQILELLKNIFDLEKCVFILAIDYDVVVKGLKPKFGELTDKNEREFRSFFDKIIQMPFSMPVASYNIDQFLIGNLQKIGFLSDNQVKNDQLKQSLTTLCSLSVGNNPRSLKRLLNTVSLINIIAKEEEDSDDTQEEDYRIALNFALICIQIAYPAIYKTLSIEGNFKSWDENFAKQLNLAELEESEKSKLGSSDEFNEEWEQVLYRVCKRDNYLSNRAFQISQLLNLMFKIVPDGQDLGSLIADLLSLSSVTDVQAFDKPKQAINKGPVLKSTVAQILPLLRAKLRAPWPVVRIQSKKIQSNAYISFSDKSWHHCIGLTIGSVKDYVVLYVWYHPWAFTQISSNMEADIKNAGFSKELDLLKRDYHNITVKYKGVCYSHPPMEKAGSAKGWHVPLLTLQFHFSNVDEMFKNAGLESVAETITEFMDVNAKLVSFYEAYNAKIRPQ
jgi:hypothetical protein